MLALKPEDHHRFIDHRHPWPDIISPTFVPTLLFSVVYRVWCEATIWKNLLREDSLDEPGVVHYPVNLPFAREVLYTLVVVDLDAPSREDGKYRKLGHQVVRITNFTILCMHTLEMNLQG